MRSFLCLAMATVALASPVAVPQLYTRDYRQPHVARQNPGDCSALPLGSGPPISPDTASDFVNSQQLANIALSAATPAGFAKSFVNAKSSSASVGYIGYYALSSYDTNQCAQLCTSSNGCSSFNIYFERDPSQVPAASCPDPASTNTIKCVLWGGYVSPSDAVNGGQYQANFQVVIAGSNGYLASNVADITGFSGHYIGNAGIVASTDCLGNSTYLTVKQYTDGKAFDAGRCAAACNDYNAYNIKQKNPKRCRYFNTYIQNKNNIPQGQYCSLYAEYRPDSTATNRGQTRGGDVYNITYSFAFTNPTDDGIPAACKSKRSVVEESWYDM